MFTAALSLADTAPQGWKTPYVLVFLILGVLLIVAFVFFETRYPYPLIPMWIWHDRDFSILLIIMAMVRPTTRARFFGVPGSLTSCA